MSGSVSLKDDYDRLSSERSPYLQRGRDCSKYTLPTLLPPTGSTSARKLRHGFSNYGARCVNSLASKMLLALMPARQAFFRFAVDDSVLKSLGGTDLRAEVDKALASMEDTVRQEIEANATRTPTGEAIKHLIVTGNILVQVLPSGGIRIYPLHSFVCQRDGEGNVLRVIAVDRVSPVTLPAAIRLPVIEKATARNSTEKTVEVYTGIIRGETGWHIHQEVEGIRVPGADGTYPLDASPWMPLRMIPVDGESYGRSMVEDYLGYFISLEGLSAALVKGTAAAAKVVYLRKPNGNTKASAITRAETGDVVDGSIDDVAALETGKAQDFRTAREMINDLKEELAYAFALNQAIQRNAERVTAEEIRYMAQELDSLLGGVYSTLSLEFQLPFLKRYMLQLQKSGRLPVLPKNILKPVLVTGLDALGRGAELDNLRAYVKDIVDLGGPESLDTYIHFDDLLKRIATARGIKTDGLNKTPEEVAKDMQAKQMQAMVQHLGPNAINQVGQLAKAGATPQGSPQ